MKTKRLSAIVMIVVFTISLLFGFITPSPYKAAFVNSTKKSLAPINSSVKELIRKGKAGYALLSLYLIILYNNLRVAAVNFLLGFTFVVPLLIIGLNGYTVGAFLSSGDYIRNAILLLPHGVVELTAVIFSSILGLDIALSVVKATTRKEVEFLISFKRNATQFKWVVVLLAIAAFIEVFITPLIYFIYLLLTKGSSWIPYS